MTTYSKWVCTGACLLAAYALLVRGLGLMNLPSDQSLYEGLAIVLGLVAITPPVLRTIWRKR
jgi:hypothetical protein